MAAPAKAPPAQPLPAACGGRGSSSAALQSVRPALPGSRPEKHATASTRDTAAPSPKSRRRSARGSPLPALRRGRLWRGWGSGGGTAAGSQSRHSHPLSPPAVIARDLQPPPGDWQTPSGDFESSFSSQKGRAGAGSGCCCCSRRAGATLGAGLSCLRLLYGCRSGPIAGVPPARGCFAPGMELCGGDAAWSRSRGRRKRRERRRRRDRDGAPDEQEEERQRQRLQEARAELLDSTFWDSSLRILLRSVQGVLSCRKEMPTGEDALLALEELQLCPPACLPGRGSLQCVCYGLGNFSSCFKARFQLAFLLLLLKQLQIPQEQCCIFDPVFSVLERDVLRSLGLSVLSRNEEGKRAVHEPTVYYMIHCGKALYNNLLWSNWSAEALSKMVIIGNSFKGIEERVPSRILETDYAYIAMILTATEEAALPLHAQYLDVFNDTAVHRFPWPKLQQVPREIWNFREEPVHQAEEEQSEIIWNSDGT
ncbi:SRR1-like protein [Sphaerodactylus townsendi]|uniref:SRR1-like protein n=1 Tax=Sphaerodactylus townsendi TaxID=933632 RepID=UPI00202654AD|nr:SRR1-like protein [Sphaerodactylus townsendi]